MKKLLLISMLIGAMPLALMAQDDDLYFVSKKKSVEKAIDNYGMPRDTYYSGSDRSVDEYNRRTSHYEHLDSLSSDIIEFDGEKGVYPDSLASDYQVTKRLRRFEGYDITTNDAFWAGYRAGRYDSGWTSPWYYSRFGWYDPWYDPWYGYAGWYGPWYPGRYYHYYGWRYPYYHSTYVIAGSRYYPRHTGTIHRGNMNGRIYGTSGSGRGGRIGYSRVGSLANRRVGGHASYSRDGSRSVSGHTSYSRPSVSGSSSSFGGFSGGARSGGGFSGGSRGGGGFSGGGRAGGGHVGGRR